MQTIDSKLLRAFSKNELFRRNYDFELVLSGNNYAMKH